LFDQTFVTGPAQTKKPWTVAISLTAQVLFVAVILILPLLHIAALSAPDRATIWLPLQPPPRAVEPQRETRAPLARRTMARAVFVAPTQVPATIDMRDMSADAPEIGPLIGSALSGPLTALSTGAMVQPIPPPVQTVKPAQPPAPGAPIRVGTGVQAAKLIFGPRPAYPALAKAARVQGVVRLQAIIARDGLIENLQVVSGPPLLVQAALAAVRQWRYQPTLLSNQPVEVATEIDVNFTLSR
jgi:periplasmic protein TonB